MPSTPSTPSMPSTLSTPSSGIAEIKYRKPELIKAMHRMDKQLQWMSMNEASGVVRPEDIAARETELLPYYQVRCVCEGGAGQLLLPCAVC